MKKQSYSSSVKQVSSIGDSDGYRNAKGPNPGAKPPIFLLPEQSPNPLLIGVKDDAMFFLTITCKLKANFLRICVEKRHTTFQNKKFFLLNLGEWLSNKLMKSNLSVSRKTFLNIFHKS